MRGADTVDNTAVIARTEVIGKSARNARDNSCEGATRQSASFFSRKSRHLIRYADTLSDTHSPALWWRYSRGALYNQYNLNDQSCVCNGPKRRVLIR